MKINRVDATVGAIKVVKTAEIIGTAMICSPVGAMIGAGKGIYEVVNKEVEMIRNLWEGELESE